MADIAAKVDAVHSAVEIIKAHDKDRATQAAAASIIHVRVEQTAAAIQQRHAAVGVSLKERPTAAAVRALIKEGHGPGSPAPTAVRELHSRVTSLEEEVERVAEESSSAGLNAAGELFVARRAAAEDGGSCGSTRGSGGVSGRWRGQRRAARRGRRAIRARLPRARGRGSVSSEARGSGKKKKNMMKEGESSSSDEDDEEEDVDHHTDKEDHDVTDSSEDGGIHGAKGGGGGRGGGGGGGGGRGGGVGRRGKRDSLIGSLAGASLSSGLGGTGGSRF